MVNKAQFYTNLTMSAHEAVLRYKALVQRKYRKQNEIRNMRNQGVMRASSDADLLRHGETTKLLTNLCEQAKQ